MTFMNPSHTSLILIHDLISSVRGTSQRLMRHRFTTIFSLILIIFFMACITWAVIYIITKESVLNEMLSPGDFFFTVYVLVFGRAMSNTFHHVYRDPSAELLRIVPLSTRNVYKGKLYSVMALSFLAFSLFFLGFLFFFVLLYPDPISLPMLLMYIFYFYLIAFFATLSGFAIPPIYYLSWGLRKKVLGFLSPALIGGAFIAYISDLETTIGLVPGLILFPAILGFFTILILVVILDMDYYFEEAMHNRIPGSHAESPHLPRLDSFIRAFSIITFGSAGDRKHRNIIAAKELLSTMRDSYFYIYAGITALLTVMGVIMILSFPSEFLEDDWGWLVYPVSISFLLYIEGSFMVTLGSLSLIGKEGKRLWVLKSLPVSGYDVLSGKTISIIIPSIIGGFAMVIPLLWVTELPAGQSLIFLVITLCIILAFSGVGVIAGTRYPNFTEGARGSPDIVFQMFVLFICLFLLAFIIIPPMTFYYNYGWMAGFVVALIVLIFCNAVFVAGVRNGERIFKRLSSEDYEGV